MVYGEKRRALHVRRELAALARAWDGGDPVDRLIACGELACGLLDWAHRRRGHDDDGELEEACHELVMAAAQPSGGGERAAAARARLEALDLPLVVEVSAALEGFSHYAVDPEQYARAARYARAESPAPSVVIGIRSIGLPLGAVVAASLPNAALVSVRPTGHPFRRALRIGERLRRRLGDRAGSGAVFAVVDEGPGLSGSSFAAVADWLEGAGVPPERICFFPSHGGDPGPEASGRVRSRWRRARRFVAEPDVAPLVAGADAIDDLAGGRWRYRLGLSPAAWPPADARLERRKLIVERGGTSWLYKFAGLGRLGRLKLERARTLEAAGHHVRVASLERGYLSCEWHDDARPLVALGDWPVPRGELVARVADYLAARAALPASGGGPGADPGALLDVARHNAGEALGAAAAQALEVLAAEVPAARDAARPVATDGRLHRWEWIALPDGRLYKTDAVDHALGHDLVGEQDIAWDLAGAEIELGLDEGELERVRARVGRAPAAGTARLYRACYLGFQLGAFAMAESLARDGGLEEEAARLAAERDRYRAHLEQLVSRL